MWRAQLEAADRAGVPALAVDLPGHGERRGERFTLEAAVDAVASGVDDVGGRALVVGLSLGGYVAIEHRARRPEQVAGLVAAGCCTPPRSPLRAGWLVVARRIERLPDHGAALNQRLVDRTLSVEGARDVGAGGFALEVMADVLEQVAACDPLSALRAATSPVWIVNGRWDHFRTSERAYLRAAAGVGAPAELVVVPRARHLVSLDAPVPFNRAVLDARHTLASRSG